MTLRRTVFDSPAELAAGARELLDAWGGEALDARGRFIVSLAGGSTPRLMYPLWAQSPGLDWSRVTLLFGDERCVPPDDEQSNARMVRETLLQRLTTQPRVHRMEGEHTQPETAAARYEATLRELLGTEGRIDVALLGIGADGHTASLFPHGAALEEASRWCVAAASPEGSMMRLTLTYPVLCRARRVVFMAAGADKAEVLADVAQGDYEPERLPSQRILRDDAIEVHLLTDRAAAARLSD